MILKDRMETNRKEEWAGIYVHVPFCRRKCIYCDFYSIGGVEKWSDAYLRQLVAELIHRQDELPQALYYTLYIGGGTPSLLPPDGIRKIVETARELIREKANGEVDFLEITMEVNPDDVSEDQAKNWAEAGINRISMGIQTLDDGQLSLLGRRHSAAQALDAYRVLQQYFSNISLDLIFGLPGQTVESFESTLNHILDLRPQHLSAYSLMYEERTALTRMRDRGDINATADPDCVAMFELLNRTTRQRGYERYELSNYSLPGYRSQHNSNYWTGAPYLGVGPSAHSYDGRRCRRYNPADIRRWLTAGGDKWITEGEEILNDEELREEMIMTRLRCMEGLDLEEYSRRFGEKARRTLERKAERLLSAGRLCRLTTDSLALTDEGVMISDEIIVELL